MERVEAMTRDVTARRHRGGSGSRAHTDPLRVMNNERKTQSDVNNAALVLPARGRGRARRRRDAARDVAQPGIFF